MANWWALSPYPREPHWPGRDCEARSLCVLWNKKLTIEARCQLRSNRNMPWHELHGQLPVGALRAHFLPFYLYRRSATKHFGQCGRLPCWTVFAGSSFSNLRRVFTEKSLIEEYSLRIFHWRRVAPGIVCKPLGTPISVQSDSRFACKFHDETVRLVNIATRRIDCNLLFSAFLVHF